VTSLLADKVSILALTRTATSSVERGISIAISPSAVTRERKRLNV